MKPIISIITRTFNSAAFVEGALESIFNQSLNKKFYEILVFDNGSDDETIDILQKYDSQIRIFIDNTSKPVALLNKAIEKASGEWIIIVDSDDFIAPDALERLHEAAERQPKAGFVYSDYYEFSNEKPRDLAVVSLRRNVYNSLAGGILIRKRLLLQCGGYDEELFFPEYKLMYQLLSITEGVYIPEPLYYYRRHGNSMTAVKARVQEGKLQLQKILGIDLPIREY